jgi:hypothetical protein
MRTRCSRGFQSGSLLVTISALALVSYLYFAAPGASGLEVGKSEIEVVESFAGQNRDVFLLLQNNSGQPMRVLGLQTC